MARAEIARLRAQGIDGRAMIDLIGVPWHPALVPTEAELVAVFAREWLRLRAALAARADRAAVVARSH